MVCYSLHHQIHRVPAFCSLVSFPMLRRQRDHCLSVRAVRRRMPPTSRQRPITGGQNPFRRPLVKKSATNQAVPAKNAATPNADRRTIQYPYLPGQPPINEPFVKPLRGIIGCRISYPRVRCAALAKSCNTYGVEFFTDLQHKSEIIVTSNVATANSSFSPGDPLTSTASSRPSRDRPPANPARTWPRLRRDW